MTNNELIADLKSKLLLWRHLARYYRSI